MGAKTETFLVLSKATEYSYNVIINTISMRIIIGSHSGIVSFR